MLIWSPLAWLCSCTYSAAFSLTFLQFRKNVPPFQVAPAFSWKVGIQPKKVSTTFEQWRVHLNILNIDVQGTGVKVLQKGSTRMGRKKKKGEFCWSCLKDFCVKVMWLSVERHNTIKVFSANYSELNWIGGNCLKLTMVFRDIVIVHELEFISLLIMQMTKSMLVAENFLGTDSFRFRWH